MRGKSRLEGLFWADQKAQEIIKRKSYHYLKKDMPKVEDHVIKTSASISGVLHIGRLSDTIRGEAVCIALRDKGCNSTLIWVAEDMDPLRKIPEGVPQKYEEYIGVPVIDIPDPWECHSSFARHHLSEYLKVLDSFISVKVKKYSMSEEYKKGSFRPYIKAILKNLTRAIEIQNKYRGEKIKDWSPWVPICKSCGKIITPKFLGLEENKISYRCSDYAFEKWVARGCGYSGSANPLRDKGKLMWKGEWAAQWARWRVSSEGAGKEYIVPTSAWWVNGEICERIFDYPMPVPIFYEHLMIDSKKMSASLGNVVYPYQWLEVAPPELLRFFYNKKLMKTRSFSWRDLPNLYDEHDYYARIFFGEEKVENVKEREHMQKLYKISQLKEINPPLNLPFSHAAMVSQIFSSDEAVKGSLKRSKHYEKDKEKQIMERISLARNWANKYAPGEFRVSILDRVGEIKKKLNNKQVELLNKLGEWLLKTEASGEEVQNYIYKLSQDSKMPLKDAFQAVYIAILGSTKGPKAGSLITSLDKKWVTERFKYFS